MVRSRETLFVAMVLFLGASFGTTENQSLAGFGSGPNGSHGTVAPDFIVKDRDVVTEGTIHLVQDPGSRTHLHVVSGTLGSKLGAGLYGPVTAGSGDS